jgi:adenylosuccinate lyase
VAAQTTTLGKRFANAGQELLVAFERSTSSSSATRSVGSRARSAPSRTARPARGDDRGDGRLERRVAAHLGFEAVLTNVGQVYPRSLDFDVVSALVQAAAGPSSPGDHLRLMAGHELVTEGFRPGQVGSSAMPHKMNSRSCERICGFHTILAGTS